MILVACECSGRVRDALLAQGLDAVSCDLKPSETPGPHIIGDVRQHLQRRWSMVIAHPTCRYLANSGVRWRVERREWEDVAAGAPFFMECLNANAPFVAVENPVMHSYARRIIGRGTASGYQGAATASGKDACAMQTGPEGKVRGTQDGVDLFAREFAWRNGEWVKLSIACGTVGQDGIKADTWYRCEGGKLMECK